MYGREELHKRTVWYIVSTIAKLTFSKPNIIIEVTERRFQSPTKTPSSAADTCVTNRTIFAESRAETCNLSQFAGSGSALESRIYPIFSSQDSRKKAQKPRKGQLKSRMVPPSSSPNWRMATIFLPDHFVLFAPFCGYELIFKASSDLRDWQEIYAPQVPILPDGAIDPHSEQVSMNLSDHLTNGFRFFRLRISRYGD